MSKAADKLESAQKIRRLYIGDNLAVMRGLEEESVDLIYLDPPFNSKRIYTGNLDTKVGRQQFSDIWTMSDITAGDNWRLRMLCPAAYELIDMLKDIHGESWQAYLTFMALRLDEMHKLLKPTGSIYLHCDARMVHPLKLLMDIIFGKDNFRNEIVWLRATKPKHSPEKFGAFSDHLLFFAKSSGAGFNLIKTPISEEDCAKRFNLTEKETARRYYLRSLDINRKDGRKGAPITVRGKQYTPKYSWQWNQQTINQRLAENPFLIVEKNGGLYFKQYADGMPVHNIWTDIAPPGKNEDAGWATQKPLALLRRIISASSTPGDVVLDPFCGCATTCLAAEDLGRQWLGIDIDPAAQEIMEKRAKGQLGFDFDWEKVEIINARRAANLPRRSGVREINKSDPKVKKAFYEEQDGICKSGEFCLTGEGVIPMELMDFDRMEPGKRGGRYTPENVCLLCRKCNATKGGKTWEEFEKAAMKQKYMDAVKNRKRRELKPPK
ncbi:MAG: hypothetical protein HAW59_00840 [Betaproteobacteria bacterium]|nr:hypothetical protein [Betaproteobacteria bacterium]